MIRIRTHEKLEKGQKGTTFTIASTDDLFTLEEATLKEENEVSMSGILLSFLAGAVVGAVVAALVTPKSGPENRRDLLELGRRAKDKAKAVTDQVGEVLAKTKAEASQTMADLKQGILEAARGPKA